MINFADFFRKANAEKEEIVNLNTNWNKNINQIIIYKMKRKKIAIYGVN